MLSFAQGLIYLCWLFVALLASLLGLLTASINSLHEQAFNKEFMFNCKGGRTLELVTGNLAAIMDHTKFSVK